MENYFYKSYFPLFKIYFFTLIILAILTLTLQQQRKQTDVVFRCGERKNGTHGHILTPNFPAAFPVPLSCKWILFAPPGKKVVLYFTQFYIRDFFYITEYDYYQDESVYVGRTDLGEVRIFDDQVIYLQGFKPYVVVSFRVAEMGNIHVRVDDFLLDVYGFNITYEIVEATKAVRTDVCSVYKCSFLGNCFASKNFRDYNCHCFTGYYGDECQYGPYCDPTLGQNVCQNGGKCRYFWGSLVNICECPPGYHGVQCELKKPGFLNSECKALGCTQKCIKHHNKMSECSCDEGYKLQNDNKTCIERGMMRFSSIIRLIDDTYHTPDPDCQIEEQIDTELNVLSSFLSQELYNISVRQVRRTKKDYKYYSVNFLGDKYGKAEFIVKWLIYNSSVCGFQFDQIYIDFHSELDTSIDSEHLVLHSLSAEIYDTGGIIEGGLLTLVCKVKGSEQIQFRWFKEGAPVNVHMTSRNMWETRIPSNDGETHISVLNIDGVLLLDEGLFTCEVDDWTEKLIESVQVKVAPKPSVMIAPMVASYNLNVAITILCASYDDANANYKYRWLINGRKLKPGEIGPNDEVMEDILPTGSRVKIANLMQGANYTCVLSLGNGKEVSNTSVIYVISRKGMCCYGEKYMGVTWRKTNDTGYDMRKCPKMTIGMTTRRCVCNKKGFCSWMYPDFSNCTSRNATEIYNKMQTVINGYQNYLLKDIIQATSQYLNTLHLKGNNITLIGDLNILSYTLWKIQEYKTRFRLVGTNSFPLMKLIDITETILIMVSHLTTEEKESVSVMSYLIKMLDHIKLINDEQYVYHLGENRRHIEIATKEVQVKDVPIPPVKLLHRQVTISVMPPVVNNKTDFYNLNVIAIAFDERKYRNTTTLNNETFLNSEAIHVDIFKDDPPFMQYIPLNFTVTFAHSQIDYANFKRKDYCAIWKFIDFPRGKWHMGGCNISESRNTHTVCQCAWSGLYALFSEYYKHEDVPAALGAVPHKGLEAVLFIPVLGFVVCIITCIVIIVRKSDVASKYMMLLNFYIVIVCLGLTLFLGLLGRLSKDMCTANIYLIQTFYMAAVMSMLGTVLVEMMRHHWKKIKWMVVFFISVAWGVPVTFFIVVSVYHTQKNIIVSLCLPQQKDSILLSSTIITSIASLILFITHCKFTHQSIQNNRMHKCHYIFILVRCFITVILLQTFIVVLIFKDHLQFLTAEVIVLMLLLILWIPMISYLPKTMIVKLKTGSPYWDSCCNSLNFYLPRRLRVHRSSSSSTFKAFVRPGTMTSLKSQCDESCEEVYERDQKFTLIRKAQLSSLLGTSSSEDSGEMLKLPLTSMFHMNGHATTVGRNKSTNRTESGEPLKPEKGTCYILDAGADL